VDRVVALLEEWARSMRLDPAEARAWRDAGAWHDALREAEEPELRRWSGEEDAPVAVLHGPAAAARLAAEGEARRGVLEAIRWHTVGHPELERTGQALFMADFLEPGRPFLQADRAFLARLVPTAFADVFRQVVRLRLEWTLREGKPLLPSTVALWNRVRLGA
jgi:2-amino-4-hydroxy-6-hydroxymethyldihydropteridine diphosphokinase